MKKLIPENAIFSVVRIYDEILKMFDELCFHLLVDDRGFDGEESNITALL